MSLRRAVLDDDVPNPLSACERRFRGAFELDTAANGVGALLAIEAMEKRGRHAAAASGHRMSAVKNVDEV